MKAKHNIEPVVLLAATTWWPLSAKLAVSLLAHGWNVQAICPFGHSLGYVSGLTRMYVYSSISSLHSLRKAILISNPVLVVPCDDGVVEQLHTLYKEQPALRPVITRSLGAPSSFPVVSSREKLLRIAEELRIRVPRNIRVSNPVDLQSWFSQAQQTAVLKQDGTFGGAGVRVIGSLDEATAEFHRLSQPQAWPTVCKRMVVNGDPIAWWNKRRGQIPELTLQEYIEGRPANIMMACLKGKMLGAVAVEVLRSQGKMGAAMLVRIIDHAEIFHAAHALATRLKLSGFYGLDFILETSTGAPFLIEMNPRCTQLGHLPLEGQGDLSGLLSAEFGVSSPNSLKSSPPGLATGETVAFFPKAFFWDKNKQFVSKGYTDAPYYHPALMEELMKPDWPDRRWPARLYHWLRPPLQEATAVFEQSATEAEQNKAHTSADCRA